MEKLGVIGGGTVGHALAKSYVEFCETRVYDVQANLRTHSLEETLDCDLVFVALPTPQQKDSLACDLTAIHQFFASIPHDHSYTHFVLRSTVPIGTTKLLVETYRLPNLVHSPEFLTARCAVTDAMLPSRNVVGVPLLDNDRGHAGGWPGAGEDLIQFYNKRFPQTPIFCVTSDESEAVKLIQNSFFAVKVAFWNEMYTLCQKLGLEWQCVLNAILADGRVDPSHTQVPGPDGKRGFGGACLIKDLSSLISIIRQSGCMDYVTDAALERNTVIDRNAATG